MTENGKRFPAALAAGLAPMALRLMLDEPMTPARVSTDETHGLHICVHLGWDCYLMIRRAGQQDATSVDGWRLMHFDDCEWSGGDVLAEDATMDQAAAIVREQIERHDKATTKPEDDEDDDTEDVWINFEHVPEFYPMFKVLDAADIDWDLVDMDRIIRVNAGKGWFGIMHQYEGCGEPGHHHDQNDHTGNWWVCWYPDRDNPDECNEVLHSGTTDEVMAEIRKQLPEE